jgi:hypothetical protein
LIIALAFPALVGLPGHAAAAPPPVVVGAAADALVAQESPTTNFGSAKPSGRTTLRSPPASCASTSPA